MLCRACCNKPKRAQLPHKPCTSFTANCELRCMKAAMPVICNDTSSYKISNDKLQENGSVVDLAQ